MFFLSVFKIISTWIVKMILISIVLKTEIQVNLLSRRRSRKHLTCMYLYMRVEGRDGYRHRKQQQIYKDTSISLKMSFYLFCFVLLTRLNEYEWMITTVNKSIWLRKKMKWKRINNRCSRLSAESSECLSSSPRKLSSFEGYFTLHSTFLRTLFVSF